MSVFCSESANDVIKTRFWKQGDRKIGKNYLIIQKVAQTKGQNLYNKAQLESPKPLLQTTLEALKCLQQTMFWNCLFRWKCNKFAKVKSSPKCRHFFELLHLFKKSQWASKHSPMVEKLDQSGQPVWKISTCQHRNRT